MTISERPDSPAIRILLIVDHPLFLAGLRHLLDAQSGMKVVGEAPNIGEALQAARTPLDIILLDLSLGGERTTDLLPDLMTASVQARVLVLTGIPDPDLHLRVVCHGAMGMVNKLEKPEVLIKAIRKVHAGEAWLNRSMMASAVTEIHTRRAGKPEPDVAMIASLTARELEVISYIGEGCRNKQIGERLFISEKTVRHYLTSIFDKLQVSDRLELMIYAYQHGLAILPPKSRKSPELVEVFT